MILRPATGADLPFIVSVQANPDYIAMIAADPEDRLKAYLDTPPWSLLIWEDDAEPMGFVLLKGPATPSRHVELVRLALARPGTGQGAALIEAVIGHAFGALGARRLWLDVAADNSRARRVYERAGFVHEGTLRQHWLRRDGTYADLALYGLLRTDRIARPAA